MLIEGVHVIVSRQLCQRPFLRWARTHRKSRINKKWRKRYGAVYAHCPGFAYQFGCGLVLCPCSLSALRSRLRLRETT